MPLPSKKLVDALADSGVISSDDRTLYIYGFHQMGVTLLNFSTDIIIGVLTGMLLESLLFLAVYISLRKFAGGYHAKTELRCYGLSTLLLCAALCGISNFFNLKQSTLLVLVMLGVMLIASTIIFILAPVDSVNKPLDNLERIVYRKKSRVVLIVHTIAFLAALAVEAKRFAAVIAVADSMLAIMVLVGAVKNRYTLPARK